MTVSQFRKVALSMPEAVESAHMDHPDFRVGGKIFATLMPASEEPRAMVKLKPDQQQTFIRLDADAFAPVKGGWGKRGATEVRLAVVNRTHLRDAVFTAWCNIAPKTLIEAASHSTSPRRAGSTRQGNTKRTAS